MDNLISSKENVHIKYAKKVMTSSKFRNQENCFLIEGIRLCEDALNNSVVLKETFYTKKCFEKSKNILEKIISKSQKSFMVSESLMNIISDTDAPQGIVCICEKNMSNVNFEDELNAVNKIVLLENIQNPSNLGTIFRTCDALKIENVIILGNGCDVYNPKVLRGSMGAVFRLNIFEFVNSLETVNRLKNFGFKIYATTPQNDAKFVNNMNFSGRFGIILGNEGNGLKQELIDICDEKIKIPMNSNAESLNVSVACGILIWEMMKKELLNER